MAQRTGVAGDAASEPDYEYTVFCRLGYYVGGRTADEVVLAVTLLGGIFIPVVLVCFFRKPSYLLPLLVIASLFEAGSVFNGSIGNFVFGVPPFAFVEVFIALRLLIVVLQGGMFLPSENNPARSIAVLLLAFLAWSLASSFVMPHVFSGMPVYSPRVGLDIDYSDLVSLQWSLSNLAQVIYLALNVAAVLYACHIVRTVGQADKLTKTLNWAVFIAVAAGLLQHLVSSYPYEVFSSNPAYYQGFDQELGDIHRISSTFAEPSMAGSFLAAVASGLLACYLSGRRGIRWLLAILLVIVVLFDTTATTGYAAFAGMLCIMGIYFGPFGRRGRNQPSFAKTWIPVLFVVCSAAVYLMLNPSLLEAFLSVTVDKMGGMSFAHRLSADIYALMIFKDTYGMGVGLGSNRPSSLVMTFLSTVGIVGTSLFAMVLYKIVKLFPGRLAPSALQMTFWSLVGLLVAQSIAVPDINRPTLWALFVVVVAQLNVYAKNRAMIAHGQWSIAPKVRISPDATAGIVPAS